MTEETRMILDKLENMEKNLFSLDTKVSSLDIRVIAEGHLNLGRKLDEALKVNQDREMLLLRVNRLESELLKRRARESRELKSQW